LIAFDAYIAIAVSVPASLLAAGHSFKPWTREYLKSEDDCHAKMPGGVNPPMEIVLSWPQANYINPDTHGNGVVFMEGFLLGLCYIIVSLRVYTRAIQARNFGIDDALICFNLVRLFHVRSAIPTDCDLRYL
jgi:hypothetical protein